ncbi:MAG: hypothetical protein IKK38_03705 [Spirochaetaceae bacterium]|nr:hypothetical protein [Spirochaetaceae bacterium]
MEKAIAKRRLLRHFVPRNDGSCGSTGESYPKNQKILPKKSPQAGKIVGLTAKNLKGYRNSRNFSKKNNFSLTKKKKM